MSELDPRAELFGSLFVLVQHLTRRVDEQLVPLGLTSRQWLLLAVLEKWFPGQRPTLTEAAAKYGSSRQNVKEIAVGLERRGWLRLVPDAVDRRATRLVLTERMSAFADPDLEARSDRFLDTVFAHATREEIERLRGFVAALLARLETDANALAGGAT